MKSVCGAASFPLVSLCIVSVLLLVVPSMSLPAANYPSISPIQVDAKSRSSIKNNQLVVDINSVGDPYPFKSCMNHASPLTVHQIVLPYPLKRGEEIPVTLSAQFDPSAYLPELGPDAKIEVSVREVDLTISSAVLSLCDVFQHDSKEHGKCSIKKEKHLSGTIKLPPVKIDVPSMPYTFSIETSAQNGDKLVCFTGNLLFE